MTSALNRPLDFAFDFHIEPSGDEAKNIRAVGRELFNLLGRPATGKIMYQNGERWQYGRGRSIQQATLTDHLLGRHTLAISPLVRKRASFLCIDIDERFEDRLGIIAEVLLRSGLLSASFATTGSRAGRGKIIITLADPMPQAHAVVVVRRIVSDLKSVTGFGADSPDHTITTFPNQGSAAGSVVRILGRNPDRGGPLESLMMWSGARLPLSHVSAQSFLRGVVPIPISWLSNHYHSGLLDSVQKGPKKPGQDSGHESNPSKDQDSGQEFDRVIERLLTEPYTGNGDVVRDDMARLARFSHFRAGEGGFTLFEEFCDLVLANADDATRGAREQLSRQDARERAWAFICSTPSFKPAPTSTSLIGEWQALERDQVKAGARAWRAYDAAVNVLRRCRMNPHALSISLSEWAREANYVDKSSALTAVHAAQDAELLFRLDRGEQSPAPGALCGIVSLRGKGETFDDAIRAGAFSDEINARFDARRERGLPPIMSTIKVPVAA